MEEKKCIPDHLRDKEYLAGEAGSFSGVPLRTVQTWTEKGLVEPDISIASGTGSKRKYSALNCIEIALIKHFADDRMKLDAIKHIMLAFKFPADRKKKGFKVSRLDKKEYKLAHRTGPTKFESYLSDGSYLILAYFGSKKSEEFNEKDYPTLELFISGKAADDPITWAVATHPQYAAGVDREETSVGFEKITIVNLRKIADRVLEKMS